MPTPNKPTKEELKKAQDDALEVVDELENKQSIPEDANPSPEEEPNEEPPQLPAEEELDEENLPEEPEEEPKPEEQADPSKELYKKKFSASSRENQKINAKNRIINQAIIEADDIPTPTDDEMKSIYGDDWDLAGEIEKASLVETQISKAWRAKIKQASDQATKIEKWEDSVAEFADNPKTLIDNPELENKLDEFSNFAIQEENNSVPFKTLIGAFLYEQSKNKPNNKSKMFERGKGGPNDNPRPKNGKLTLEEGRALRESNYSEWKQKLNAGLIDFGI